MGREGGEGGEGGGPNLEKVVKLAVVYYNHFIGVRFVVNTRSVGLGLRLDQSGWTMSTALVQNQH